MMLRIRGQTTLLLEAELLHERTVGALVVFFQVFQMFTAISYESQKSTSRVLIFIILAQMSRKLLDSACQNGDLHLWRPRIGVVALRLRDFVCLLSLR